MVAEGELWLGGRAVAAGYLNAAAKTTEKFVAVPGRQRAYRTGDRVRLIAGEEGASPWLEFGGRMDDQLKVRGFRVERGEIEATLRAGVPGSDAEVVDAVVGLVHGGSVLGAVVRVAGGHAMESEALAAAAGLVLPPYAVPSLIFVVDDAALPAWPVNPVNGKLDRPAILAAAFGAESAAVDAAGDADRDVVEAGSSGRLGEMVAVWREVFSGRLVEADDSFYSLGGHSLLALRLLSAVQRAFPGAAAGLAITHLLSEDVGGSPRALASYLGLEAGGDSGNGEAVEGGGVGDVDDVGGYTRPMCESEVMMLGAHLSHPDAPVCTESLVLTRGDVGGGDTVYDRVRLPQRRRNGRRDGRGKGGCDGG